ncbi:MAG: flagellar motor switch protein FliN [Gemmatimonadales bacterium]
MSNQDAGATPPSIDYSATVAQPAASLDTLLDMSLPVSIEFGRTSLTVQDVLALSTGSVIQLERMVGEPIDVFVSDRKLAEGEVVVIGEHFGVRITRIIADQEGNEA